MSLPVGCANLVNKAASELPARARDAFHNRFADLMRRFLQPTESDVRSAIGDAVQRAKQQNTNHNSINEVSNGSF